jgi:hypothetical protein
MWEVGAAWKVQDGFFPHWKKEEAEKDHTWPVKT